MSLVITSTSRDKLLKSLPLLLLGAVIVFIPVYLPNSFMIDAAGGVVGGLLVTIGGIAWTAGMAFGLGSDGPEAETEEVLLRVLLAASAHLVGFILLLLGKPNQSHPDGGYYLGAGAFAVVIIGLWLLLASTAFTDE